MGRFHHIFPGNLIRLIRYVTLRRGCTILHYIFVFGVISGGNQHGHITNENGFVMIYQIL